MFAAKPGGDLDTPDSGPMHAGQLKGADYAHVLS